jgi:DNA-binding protein H-NS
MSKHTLAQITKQIAALQAQAEKIRNEERAGVIARVKQTIAEFGLGVADIFGGRRGAAKRAARKASKSKISAAPAYADGTGNEWVGRGPRPKWLREALANGHSLDEFRVGASGSVKAGTTTAKAVKPTANGAGRRAAKVSAETAAAPRKSARAAKNGSKTAGKRARAKKATAAPAAESAAQA